MKKLFTTLIMFLLFSTSVLSQVHKFKGESWAISTRNPDGTWQKWVALSNRNTDILIIIDYNEKKIVLYDDSKTIYHIINESEPDEKYGTATLVYRCLDERGEKQKIIANIDNENNIEFYVSDNHSNTQTVTAYKVIKLN